MIGLTNSSFEYNTYQSTGFDGQFVQLHQVDDFSSETRTNCAENPAKRNSLRNNVGVVAEKNMNLLVGVRREREAVVHEAMS